jgi:ubiquinone/menaquinone biosynthesis C-methylase UbiE
MAHEHADVCTWWYAYFFDNPLRGLLHDAERILRPYVGPGMTVLDVGCGMGFFSLALARMVGDTGTVIAADLEPKMLNVVGRRARRRGLVQRIRPHLCQSDGVGVLDAVDFGLAFWMVHEVPDQRAFMDEMHGILKPGGHLFIAEPKAHATEEDFRATSDHATAAGYESLGAPSEKVRMSHAAVFRRSAD